jgi:copper(I)-binding protein
MGRVLAALLLAAVAARPAAADGAVAGDLTIENPWARASIGSAANGAAYMTVRNRGSTDDRLLAVRTPAARKVELHSHAAVAGVVKMRRVDSVEVPAGGTAAFEPEGHQAIMLLGLRAPLKEGESIVATVLFEKAGEVEVQLPVRRMKAMDLKKYGQ